MPSFANHLLQAKSNLQTLKILIDTNSFDWQVTVCFYTALHLINAHLAMSDDKHVNSHVKTKDAISPFNANKKSSIDKQTYLDYEKLENQSRMARYLCSEKGGIDKVFAHFTNEIHSARAMRRLNTVMKFMAAKYSVKFDSTLVTNRRLEREIRNSSLEYFLSSQSPASDPAPE